MGIDFASHVRRIEDFPRPGITTFDTAAILKDPALFRAAVDELARPYAGDQVDAVIGIDARGFVPAAALARALGAGVVMIRKRGKLPPPVVTEEYSYEYASSAIEIGAEGLKPGARVVLVDDVLATGGTLAAAVALLASQQVTIIGIACMVEVSFMDGRSRLGGIPVHALAAYG